MLPYFSLLALQSWGKEYKKNDPVPVLVNSVGPYNNPAETYPYYRLPFCAPDNHVADPKFGEVLAGDRRRNSLYDLRFVASTEYQMICKTQLNQEDIKKFYDAVTAHYIFEMFVDNLPLKGFIGDIEEVQTKFDDHLHNETKVYLFTHLDFEIAYNGPHVIACNLSTDPSQRIELVYGKSLDVEFSFSASWRETATPYIDRLSLHQRSTLHDQALEVHWLSIINSLVLVLLLTAFLAIILVRILKKDLAKYMEIDDEDLDEMTEETGWKQLHTEVFRPPKNLMLLSAATGAGTQIFVMVVAILLLSLVGTFYPGNRGAVYTAAIVIYCLTASICGYVSTRMYVSLGGTKWATNAVLAACLFAVPLFIVFSVLNSVAISYGSSTALPFWAIFSIIILWAFLTFPLTVIGSMKAKNTAAYSAPCKTNQACREIPPAPWYRRAGVQLFIAGFLPFSAIYIELHYIFASVWGHRTYTVFGILCIAFLMLLIVTAFITIALTYFQLAVEDYHWWWRSFLSGASTGVFMYAYAWFYFHYRSEMTGTLQTAFFFGYMLVVAYAFALMLGAVGFFVSERFVRYIYGAIKVD